MAMVSAGYLLQRLLHRCCIVSRVINRRCTVHARKLKMLDPLFRLCPRWSRAWNCTKPTSNKPRLGNGGAPWRTSDTAKINSFFSDICIRRTWIGANTGRSPIRAVSLYASFKPQQSPVSPFTAPFVSIWNIFVYVEHRMWKRVKELPVLLKISWWISQNEINVPSWTLACVSQRIICTSWYAGKVLLTVCLV